MGVTTPTAARDLTLPRLGETMEEARVADWLVAPGEAFTRGQTLLEVETDKTVVEVPALSDGVLEAHLVAPGDTVAIGQPIARVRGDAAPEVAAAPVPSAEAPPPRPEPLPAGTLPQTPPDRVAASPKARRMARAAGLDLALLAGSGRRGWVSATDVAGAGGDAPARHRPAPPSRLAVARHDPPADVPPLAGAALVLHGLFASGQGLAPLARTLAARGLTAFVPDLPGHGDSPAEAPTLDGAVGELVAMLDAAAPTGPLRLFGHSMGAVLAVRLAHRMPAGRVERLVLSAPAGLAPRLARDFLDPMLAAETPAALRRALGLLGGSPLSEALVAEELARLRRHRPAQRALAQELAAGGVQQVDLAAELAGLTVPVRALFGLDDRIADWTGCARLPVHAAIHLRPGAGHLPHLGAEKLVADFMLAPL